MVRQERQGRGEQYLPENNIRILPETTLEAIGIDTNYDNLNLAADGFIFGVKQAEGGTIYCGLLEHPFAEEHFVHFLNMVAPFGGQNKDGIVGDLNLPSLASSADKNGMNETTQNSLGFTKDM